MKYFRYAALAALSAATVLFCSCAGDTAADNAPVGESNGGTIGVDFKGEPKISYVLPRFLNDAQTRSIYEVFTGDEINYGKLTMRTNPEKRAGMYFFVMFGYEPDDIALACTFELSVDSTADSKTRTYKFTVPETHSVTREVVLALTGADWPNPKAKVNAWKLVLKSPSGKVLAQKQSWLWEDTAAAAKSEK